MSLFVYSFVFRGCPFFLFIFGISETEQEFFAELQEREKEFGIADIQLGLTTLEEVFLNIARQADLESAIAEGRMVTLTLDSGFSLEVSATYSFNFRVEIFIPTNGLDALHPIFKFLVINNM